jgi:hypothetical protein
VIFKTGALPANGVFKRRAQPRQKQLQRRYRRTQLPQRSFSSFRPPHTQIDIETLNYSQWTIDLPSRVSCGAQVEHNKASENCFIAAMTSGDVVMWWF